MPASSTWEKVASFPGWVAYAPLWLTFETVVGVIVLNDRVQVIPKTIAFLTTEDGRRGVLPTFASRSGIGVRYFANDILNPGSRFRATVASGMRGRRLFEMHYFGIDLFDGAVVVTGRAQYRNMSDERFYGIGPGAEEDDETTFRHKRALAELTVGIPLREKLRTGIAVGYEHNIIGQGRGDSVSITDVLTENELPGLEEESSMARIELALHYDGKNRAVRPSAGLEAELRGGVTAELTDDDFGFSTIGGDISKYLHIRNDRILVFRLAATFVDPVSDRRVPFYSLSELGRTNSIRGYRRGRFRDRDMILGSIEYRYPVWRAMDALFFVDAGQVSNNIDANDLQLTFGGGFRVWEKKGTFLRLEIGVSDDGYRFHFFLN
jgi:outer membrane protein assembly factor BamA